MALWEDPISFNQLSIYGISNKRNSQGGISYKNEQILPFSIAYSSNKKNYFLDLGLYETLVHQSKQQLKVKAHYLKNTKRNYQKAFISTLSPLAKGRYSLPSILPLTPASSFAFAISPFLIL